MNKCILSQMVHLKFIGSGCLKLCILKDSEAVVKCRGQESWDLLITSAMARRNSKDQLPMSCLGTNGCVAAASGRGSIQACGDIC